MNSTAVAHLDGYRYRCPATPSNGLGASGNTVKNSGNGDDHHHQSKSMSPPQDHHPKEPQYHHPNKPQDEPQTEHQESENKRQTEEAQSKVPDGAQNGENRTNDEPDSNVAPNSNTTLNALRQEYYALRKRLAELNGSQHEAAILKQKVESLQQLCKCAQAALDAHRNFRKKVREAAVPIMIIQHAFRDELAEQNAKGLDIARAALEENFSNLLAAAFDQQDWTEIEEEARRIVEELEADCCPHTQLEKFTAPIQRNTVVIATASVQQMKQASSEQPMDLKKPATHASMIIHGSSSAPGQKAATDSEDSESDTSDSEDDEGEEDPIESECTTPTATSPAAAAEEPTNGTTKASIPAKRKFDHAFEHLSDMPSLDPDNHEWFTPPLGTRTTLEPRKGTDLSDGLLIGHIQSTTGPVNVHAHITDTKRGASMRYRTEVGAFLTMKTFCNRVKFIDPLCRLTRGDGPRISTQLLRSVVLLLFERRMGRELPLESRTNHEKSLFGAFKKIRGSGKKL